MLTSGASSVERHSSNAPCPFFFLVSLSYYLYGAVRGAVELITLYFYKACLRRSASCSVWGVKLAIRDKVQLKTRSESVNQPGISIEITLNPSVCCKECRDLKNVYSLLMYQRSYRYCIDTEIPGQ